MKGVRWKSPETPAYQPPLFYTYRYGPVSVSYTEPTLLLIHSVSPIRESCSSGGSLNSGKETGWCLNSLHLTGFGDPVHTVASDSCSWLKGMEPEVVVCCRRTSASSSGASCVLRCFIIWAEVAQGLRLRVTDQAVGSSPSSIDDHMIVFSHERVPINVASSGNYVKYWSGGGKWGFSDWISDSVRVICNNTNKKEWCGYDSRDHFIIIKGFISIILISIPGTD